MGEQQGRIFIDCLKFVFHDHFGAQYAPGALESGSSQESRIDQIIRGAHFAFVLLDGLRPNVVYEWGLLRGGKTLIFLFKEEEATVDIPHLLGRSVSNLAVPNPLIDLDKQFSNVKDLNYCTWNRYRIKETIGKIWAEYHKKKSELKDFVDIPKPDFSA